MGEVTVSRENNTNNNLDVEDTNGYEDVNMMTTSSTPRNHAGTKMHSNNNDDNNNNNNEPLSENVDEFPADYAKRQERKNEGAIRRKTYPAPVESD